MANTIAIEFCEQEGRAGFQVVYEGTSPRTGVTGSWPYFYTDLAEALPHIDEWILAPQVDVAVDRLLSSEGKR